MVSQVPGVVTRTPENKNTLLDNKFRFVINKIPHVIYFTQSVTLPGFTINRLTQPTMYMPIPVAATQPDFNTFSITFEVDEDLKNYREIYNWMIGISFPDDMKQYADLINSNSQSSVKDIGNIYSDGRLMIYTAHFTKNIEIIFERMFPVSISDIDFNTRSNADTPKVTVVFQFRRFKFEDE